MLFPPYARPVAFPPLVATETLDALPPFPAPTGDVDTVLRHLRVLRSMPAGRDVYSALARAALRYLPAKNRSALKQLLESGPA